MKKTISVLAIVVGVIMIAGCSKDNRLIPIPRTLDCSSSLFTFSQKLQGQFAWCDLIEDAAKNIVIAGMDNIQRYSPEGTLQWKTGIAFPGQLQNIIQADGDHYFITSATNEVEAYGNYDLYNEGHASGWLDLSNYYDTWGNLGKECKPTYNRITLNSGSVRFTFKPLKPVNKSTCALSKVNDNGQLVWQKNFRGNYYSGTSVCKANDGNIYLLTFVKRGFYKSAVFDANDIFQDTLISPYVRDNFFVLYKVSPEGDVVWERTINQVYHASPDYDSKINLAVTSSAVFIQNKLELVVLTHKGDMVKREPAGINCAYNIYGCVSHNDQVLITGYGANPSNSGYYAMYAPNGAQVSSDYTVSLPTNAQVSAAGDGFVFSSSNSVVKYNSRFMSLWSITTYNRSLVHVAKGTCSGGVIMVESSNNEYTLTKLDEDGRP